MTNLGDYNYSYVKHRFEFDDISSRIENNYRYTDASSFRFSSRDGNEASVTIVMNHDVIAR